MGISCSTFCVQDIDIEPELQELKETKEIHRRELEKVCNHAN